MVASFRALVGLAVATAMSVAVWFGGQWMSKHVAELEERERLAVVKVVEAKEVVLSAQTRLAGILGDLEVASKNPIVSAASQPVAP